MHSFHTVNFNTNLKVVADSVSDLIMFFFFFQLLLGYVIPAQYYLLWILFLSVDQEELFQQKYGEIKKLKTRITWNSKLVLHLLWIIFIF